MKYRFKQTLVDLGSAFALLTYDLQERRLVDELCEYAAVLADRLQLSRLTVQQELGYLRGFWAFLTSGNLAPNALSDDVLKSFREEALAAVMRSPSYRGSRYAAEETVNAKLIRIYDWIWWLQESGRVRPGLIGHRATPVLSSLESSSCAKQPWTGHRVSTLSARYPLLYRVKTARSKHALPKTIPTEKMLDAVHAYFFSKSLSPFARHRNCLIADIASHTGFRRASIQSLHVDQFVGTDFVLTDRETVILKPARQKFDYGNTFEIPAFLHELIKQFITSYRQPFIDAHAVPATLHQGAIFISARDGKPLTDRALTALISRAMRACGAAKGTALHAWRAKFAVEEVANEYEHRSALGLDTSADTIERAVALKLGHKNSQSMRAYTSWHEASEVARRRSGQHKEQLRDRERIHELEKELAALRSASLKRIQI
ncbi:hypothetical protein [Variovorax paradoxus]|uniref:hypothetical protein n=1 Tax=Variovorax paradoxus TaxID=34073 RepID=UPI003392B95D